MGTYFHLYHRIENRPEMHGFWASQGLNLLWLTFYGPRLLLWRQLFAIGFLDADVGDELKFRKWPGYLQWPSVTWANRRARGTSIGKFSPWDFYLFYGLGGPFKRHYQRRVQRALDLVRDNTPL